MVSFCSEKIICIFKRNNVNTCSGFLLFLLVMFRIFIIFIGLHLLRTKNKLSWISWISSKTLWDFCTDKIPSKGTKILEFSQHRKSDNRPSNVHIDLKFLIKKIDECKNNSKSSKIKGGSVTLNARRIYVHRGYLMV